MEKQKDIHIAKKMERLSIFSQIDRYKDIQSNDRQTAGRDDRQIEIDQVRAKNDNDDD